MSPAPFEASAAQLDGEVSVVTIRGELDLSTAGDLERLLDEAIDSGDGLLLIDLGACEFIDSTGIALIVRSWQRFDRGAGGEGNGRMGIFGSVAQVRRVLEITGLEHSIPMYESRDEALAALRD